jgi:hypothetical protein
MLPSKRNHTGKDGDAAIKKKRAIPQKHWTVCDDEDEKDISHEELIGEGGYGEVHRVQLPMND